MNQLIDFSSLIWVKGALYETLKEARRLLETHVENPDDGGPVERLVDHIHQAHGTLQMVELDGASSVAEEMERVARAIAGEAECHRHEACDALMRAMLQLPDYLDRLLAGYPDIPLVLLPIVNDLRVARGADPIPEEALFSPDLDAMLPDGVLETSGDPSTGVDARALRHRFQRALVDWFRDHDSEPALHAIADVLEALRRMSGSAKGRRFWWVAAGLIDGLRSGALESTPAVKRLVGQLDRYMRGIVELGEEVLAEATADALLRNLLFCVARLHGGSPRIAEIQSVFRLSELLPGEGAIAAARESLSGRNADLFKTVAVAVKEELGRLKDSLDLILRSGSETLERLQPLITALRSLGDTLGVLSLENARDVLLAKAQTLTSYADAQESPPDTVMMDIASTLLFVESSVDHMGVRLDNADRRGYSVEELAGAEYLDVMDAVFREAIANFAGVKEAILAYTGDTSGHASLRELIPLFRQIEGGMLLLGDARAAAVARSMARYADAEMVKADKPPPQRDLEVLADCICGLEYYLEGRKERCTYGAGGIRIAEQSIAQLGYSVADPDPGASANTGAGASTEYNSVPDSSSESESASADGASESGTRPEAGLDAGLALIRDIEEAARSPLPVGDEPVAKAPRNPDASQSRVPEPKLAECANIQSSEIAQGLPRAATQQAASGQSVAENEEGDPGKSARAARGTASLCREGQQEPNNTFPILNNEVDGEILGVFLEEAEEEIARIEEQLPVWVGDPGNRDALGCLRRSFHTLKGSGRMIGAMRIGEFAWAFENLLNHLIEGTVQMTAEVANIMHASQTVLPGLVQEITSGAALEQSAGYLMDCANALSRGDLLPPAPDSGTGTEPRAQTLEKHDGSTSATHSPPTWRVRERQRMLNGHLEEAGVDSGMDPLLYGIFSTEARGYLETVRHFVARAHSGNSKVDEALLRALHTLHGSAHLAQAVAIGDLAGELEKLCRTRRVMQAPLSLSECKLLEQSASLIDDMLNQLAGDAHSSEGCLGVAAKIRAACETARSIQYASAAMEPGTIPAEATDHQDGPPAGTSARKAVVSSGTLSEGSDHAQADPKNDAHRASSSESAPANASTDTDPYADAELLEVFLEECEENLDTSERALQQWRQCDTDSQALAELQRALHTLKGGARMAGLSAVGDLAHAVESLVVAIVDGRCASGVAAFDVVQGAHDRLVRMVESVRAREPLSSETSLIETLTALFRKDQPGTVTTEARSSAETMEQDAAPHQSGHSPSDAERELAGVFLEEAGDILRHAEETLRAWKDRPNESGLVDDLRRELHTLKGGARMADIAPVGDLAHALESFLLPLTGDGVTPDAAALALSQQTLERLAGMLEQLRRQQPISTAPDLIAGLNALGEIGKTAHGAGAACAPEADRAAAAVTDDAEHLERRSNARVIQELVRVKASLLDNLVNYAGEASIYRARLEQQIGAYRFNLMEMEQTVIRLREQLRKLEIETEAQILFRYEKEAPSDNEEFDPLEMDRYSQLQQLSRGLAESVADLGSIHCLLANITRESEALLLQQSRVNTDLQEGLMRTRMVPFRGLAPRMRRIVRQTCYELGKKAELELSGADGEMDRTVVDRIIAPIEHMLRNAISHGIESPDQRRDAGKPETGTIRVTLERESSDIILKIADDGAGFNLPAIRHKAIERGLIDPSAELSDGDISQFILESGFSTAEKITQVAGRGVGMDVVNSEVKQLGGSLQIASDAGKGSTFTIRLPFTLALTQALLVEVGGDTYAIPLASIEGIVRMGLDEVAAYLADPGARFQYGATSYEIRQLACMLGVEQESLSAGSGNVPVLLARFGDRAAGLQVDNLLGSREIVVKSVGPQISAVRGITGATILGDGRVVMILDLSALLRGSISVSRTVPQSISRPEADNRATVMVVDDSITVRKVTTRLLERNNMKVIAASDGVDAVAKLQESKPNIMLLDIEMPRMDGFELATHVRNEARLRDIPIVMITSRSGDKHRQRAMQIGINRYLVKPFQEAELLENIRTLLDDGEMRAQLDG